MFSDLLIALTLLVNFAICSTSRIQKLFQLAVVQGVILGLMPLAMGLGHQVHIIFMSLLAIGVKGWLIPYLFRKAFKRTQTRREVEPYIGYNISLVICALVTGLSLLFASHLPTEKGQNHPLILSASLATLFTGALILVSRRKAITQVVGYLVLENGIYLFSLLLIRQMPLLVETGILLDLFVGIFIMGIVIHHISIAFDSTDTHQLTHLKD